ncbi:ligand-binding protein SH3 [Burkholderia sp. WSM2230]|uniref:ligand-binding protein SH3 n=1 Tax=Burkholderia sp. WSM2230 TaxID=944435 RepID=UPI000472F386|nr:ligand-binding protein SH3 [Burkholderia sp. WSM2230]
MQFFFLFMSGTCSALASVLLRLAGRVDNSALLFGMTGRPFLYRLAAIAAYGAGFALYALALRRVELSVAYPLMVAVTILEILLFGVVSGEAVSLRIVLGAALLLVSVLLLYLPAKAGA